MVYPRNPRFFLFFEEIFIFPLHIYNEVVICKLFKIGEFLARHKRVSACSSRSLLSFAATKVLKGLTREEPPPVKSYQITELFVNN